MRNHQSHGRDAVMLKYFRLWISFGSIGHDDLALGFLLGMWNGLEDIVLLEGLN